MKIAEAYVEVRAKTDKAEQDLKTFEGKAVATARSAGTSFGQLFGGLAVGAGIKKTIDAASDLEQAIGGTAAVFGEASSEIDSFAKTSATSAGLSERAARELTAQLGGLLSGFGFTKKEAAALSIELTKLGGDLSATFGGKPEEAVQALGAAMRGETDPIERYGISLNQAAVNAKAVELGLASSTSTVDANAKAQATLAIITEKSAGAQGQFAREADSAAGKAAISAAKIEDNAAKMGDQLLPVYAKATEVVGLAADAFGALPGPIQTGIIALAGVVAVASPVKAAFSAVSDGISAVASKLSRDVAPGADVASGKFSKLGTALGALGAVGAVAGLAALAAETNKVTVDVDELARATANATDAQKEQLGQSLVAAEGFGKLDEIVRQTADTNVEAATRLLDVAEAAGISSERIDELRGIVEEKAGADVQAAVDQEKNTEAVEAGTEANKTNSESIAEQIEKLGELRTALIASFDSNLAYRTSVDGVEDAVRALSETEGEHTKSSEEYSDALRGVEGDMLAQAASAVKLAEDQAKANGATLTAEDKTRIYKEELQRLAAKFPELAGLIQDYINQLNAIPRELTTTVILKEAGYRTQGFGAVRTGKAQGGGVQAGDIARVGENGPEVVQFGQAGTVIPNHDLGRGGGTTFNGPVTIVSSAGSPRELYDESLWKIGLAG